MQSNGLTETLAELRLTPDNPNLRRALCGQILEIVWPSLAKCVQNIRYLTPDCDREDIVNETLYRIFRWSLGRATSSPGEDLNATDLISVAIVTCKNVIRDTFRHKAVRDRSLELENSEHAPGSSSPLVELVLGERAETVRDALESLNLGERRIVEMRFYQGKTYDDIGNETGLSPEGVRYRLRLIMKKLEVWVSKHS